MRSLLLVVWLAPTLAAASPASFSWGKYVSPARDQLRQGPCHSFAATGAVAAMRDLFYGAPSSSTPDLAHTRLSERHVYFCANASGVNALDLALGHIQRSGAIASSCLPYEPTGAVRCDPNLGNQWPVVIPFDFDCQATQNTCGLRDRADFEEVTTALRAGVAAIQSTLLTRGPLALTLSGTPLHGGATHSYVLLGWKAEGSDLRWLLRDSWPCGGGASPLESELQLATRFGDGAGRAFAITRVTEERLSSGTWLDTRPTIVPFELEPENQVVQIAGTPDCFNRGTFTVSGLDQLPGASVLRWAVRSPVSGGASIAAVGSQAATLTGDGEDVTLVATIQRANGLLENVTRRVGNVGFSVHMDQTANGCSGTYRQVSVSVGVRGPDGSRGKAVIHAPASADYSVSGDGSSSATFFFSRPSAATFTVSATGTTAGGCSTSFDVIRYVIGMPCNIYGSPY